ncbi:E3 ubiquitin-protein ligase HOS1 isoform X2 [Typha latifolia]
MKSKLDLFQKFAMQLTGISSVLEIMVLSFKETVAAQVHDLHQLLESTMKAKQHLEVMIWCIRHQFLEGVQSRFPNVASWKLHVLERKLEAVRRAWPDYSNNTRDSFVPNGTILFIEQALANLRIEQSYIKERVDDVDISSLQDENSPSLFLSKIDAANRNGYPFKSLRTAADVLFLHGISDTVVAKQAILLYYLFDRHWSKPDVEWQYLIHDFSATFGITRHSVLESLVFFLLDDHTFEALQEASRLLPEIAGPETHPKIAQVLLERQCPDVALTVLRCTGRDDFFSSANIRHDDSQFPSLGEAVTAVRVRIECGLLTEAFIYHRIYCSRVKEEKSKHVALTNIEKSDSWIYHVEVLVTEICYLCMRRNLVDRMIELPWNSDEEKYLHKCLFDHAQQSPSTIYGSLLVVFYLQRYRYSEAYRVDHTLQNSESSTLEIASEDIASRIRLIAQWRQGLVVKCLQLLPEVQQQKVISANEREDGQFPLHDVPGPLASDLSNESPSPALFSSMTSLVGRQEKLSSHSKMINDQTVFYSPSSNAGSEFGSKGPAILQHGLLATLESPISRMNSVVPDGTSNDQNGEVSKLKNIFNVKGLRKQADLKQRLPSQCAPFKELNTSSLRLTQEDTRLQGEKEYVRMNLFDLSVHAENSHPFMPRVTSGGGNKGWSTSHNDGTIKQLIDETNVNFRSFENRDSPIKHQSMKGGLRWRSDESSEDEEDYKFDYQKEDGVQFGSRRRARFSRR